MKAEAIIEIECLRYTIDWYDSVTVKIDLEEWTFFTVDYRGENDWHLIGHKVKDDKWVQEEFSHHGIYRNSLVNFIAKANAHKDKHGQRRCRISRFNNMHYYSSFYKDLANLLNDVSKRAEPLTIPSGKKEKGE